jgi:hypothetical protein
MDKVHNLFFCTQCGFKLSGQEYNCPGCGLKLAEPPVLPVDTTNPETPPAPQPVAEVKAVPPVKEKTPVPEVKVKPEKIKKKKGLGIVWLIIIIFFGVVIIGGGAVVFLQYNGNINIAFLKEYIPVKNTIQITAVPEKKNDISKPAEENNGPQVLGDTAKQQGPEQENRQVSQNENSTATSMNYFIIAGSYSNNQQALEAVGNLKAKGYPDASIVGQNESGLWRICYKSFLTRQEALQDIESIRQKDNPSAWVFEQK